VKGTGFSFGHRYCRPPIVSASKLQQLYLYYVNPGITVDPLGIQAQTVFAELVERLQARAAGRTIAQLSGSFATKTVKGRDYWYFKTSVPGRGQVEYYLGPDSTALREVVARQRTAKPAETEEEAGIAALCRMLRAAGAMRLDSASARVVSALSDAGVFDLGGVLVGTHAFVALGNVLGVRWSRATRTQDVDIVAPRNLSLAVPRLEADVPSVLESLDMGFLPVPGLDPRRPSTSFKVRGRELRVDVLTPLDRGAERGPVRIPRLNLAATPLRFLGYLMEDALSTAVLDGSATLARVPDPARFALHKLLLSTRRPPAEQTKANKDRAQAAELLGFLADERPRDVRAALRRLRDSYPGAERFVRRGAARLPAGAGRELVLRELGRTEPA
jgi:hypothetical protein